MKQAALDFVRYLRANGLTFFRDVSPCWKDKVYYWVKCGDACVCYIAINDPQEPEHAWTVWSEDSPIYEKAPTDEAIRRTGLQYINHCSRCGSCGGGKEKTIFGESYSSICGCTFRIDNAATDF